MVLTKDITLPSEKELTVPELNLTSGPLIAAAHHLGKFCDNQCKEFMLCWYESHDPRACLNEGKEVTKCGLNFFRQVKKHCAVEFTQYFDCLDKRAGPRMNMTGCRDTQAVFDGCILQNMGQERPEYGYFSKVRLHKTDRPKPQIKMAPMPDRIPDLPNLEDRPDPDDLKIRLKMKEMFK